MRPLNLVVRIVWECPFSVLALLVFSTKKACLMSKKGKNLRGLHSPDPNPTAHRRDKIERVLQARHSHPTLLPDLTYAFWLNWHIFLQSCSKRLCKVFPVAWRCKGQVAHLYINVFKQCAQQAVTV